MELRICILLIVLGCLIALSFPAHADSRTATIEGVVVTLTDDKCANGRVLQFIDYYAALYPKVAGEYFAGSGKGEDWESEMCFKPLDAERIFVIDEIGVYGGLSLKPFMRH